MSAPDIITFKEIAMKANTGNKKPMISKKFIENLFSIVNDGKGLLSDTEESKFQFLELIGLVHNLGEKNVMELVLENKRMPLSMILRNSEFFISSRKRQFIDSTVKLKHVKKIENVVFCRKCKSNQVRELARVQTRGADEPTTEKYECMKCGKHFSMN